MFFHPFKKILLKVCTTNINENKGAYTLFLPFIDITLYKKIKKKIVLFLKNILKKSPKSRLLKLQKIYILNNFNPKMRF